MKRHLTDGEIHAWLDGELDDAAPEVAATSLRHHLEGCDACRARLDGEAALRERAVAILADAAPSVGVLPSIEELRARARATDPGRLSHRAGSRLAHLRRWAWAASVVVALGIGWAVRDRAPVPGEGEIEAAGEAAQLRGEAPGAAPGGTARLQGAAAGDEPMPAREMPAAGEGGAAARSGEVLASRSGDVAVGRPGDAPASGADETAAGAGVAAESGAGDAGAPTGDDSVAVAPAQVVADAAESDAGVKAVGDVPDPAGPTGDRRAAATYAAGPDARPEPPVADSPRESPRTAQEAVALDELVVTGAPVVDSESPPVSALLDPPAPMAPMAPMATPGRDPEPRRGAVEVRRTRPPPGAGDEAGGAGALVLTVESLDVLSVVWGEVAPGVRGVKVLQRLEPSDTLELVVIPGGADDEEAEAALATVLEEPLRPGWSRVVRVREGARIVARAPLPAADLSRLVEGVGRR